MILNQLLYILQLYNNFIAITNLICWIFVMFDPVVIPNPTEYSSHSECSFRTIAVNFLISQRFVRTLFASRTTLCQRMKVVAIAIAAAVDEADAIVGDDIVVVTREIGQTLDAAVGEIARLGATIGWGKKGLDIAHSGILSRTSENRTYRCCWYCWRRRRRFLRRRFPNCCWLILRPAKWPSEQRERFAYWLKCCE